MATWTSDAFSTDNTYIKYKIYITENSISVSNNTSSVTVKVKCYRTNTGYTTYGSGTITCTINGTKYTASIDTSDKITSSGIYLFSKTVTIAHNSDGTKTLTVSASIDHSRFTASTHSYSHALTTIPRKSSLTAGNGTLNIAQTFTISRASSSFTHTITYKCGSASGTIASKTTATSVSWTPPLSLASQNTSGTTVSVTLTLTTYSGSTSIGSVTKTIKCTIPSSVKPSCEIAVSDAAGYSGTYGGYLKGLSRLKITVIGTTSYGSAIKSYAVSANGSNYTSASVTTGVLKTAGTMTITAKVTDKRGRSASVSQNITVLDYNAPQIKLLSVSRCNSNGTANDQGEYAKVTLSAVVTALSNKNTAAYVLQYKKHSAASYTSVTLTSLANKYTATNYSDSKCIFPAESGSTYDVILKVTDKFGSTTKETSLSTAVTIMHYGAKGNSFAFGKISEYENTVEYNWDAKFYKKVLIGNTLYMNNGVDGEDRPVLQIFDDGSSSGDGSELTIGAGGNVFIGAGESYSQMRAALNTPTTEQLILSADSTIRFFTNCQTIANKVESYIDTNGCAHFKAYYENGTALSSKYAAKSHSHSYLPLSGGTLNGGITLPNAKYLNAKNAGGDVYVICGINGSNQVIFGADTGQNYFRGGQINMLVFSSAGNATWNFIREPSGSKRAIFRPEANNGGYLGTTSYRWNTVFCTTLSEGSDKKLKDHIKYLSEEERLTAFLNGLKPAMYTLKDGEGHRTHMGLYAQEVNDTALKTIGDIAAVKAAVVQTAEIQNAEPGQPKTEIIEGYYDPKAGIPDENLMWSLSYTELVPVLIAGWQIHEQLINDLKKEIKTMTGGA